MSPPKSTLWPIDPHTRGKHQVLRNYLNAWLPIMATRNGRILFIDGFSGPGQYEGGEDGSPLIAMKALCDHSAKGHFRAKIVFLFVDDDPRRTAHLNTVAEPLKKELGERAEVHIETGPFDETVGGLAQELASAGEQLAPAFVMVDPFGVSDTPMSVIGRILKHAQSEVFITFMWDFINRLHSTEEYPPHLDALFGTPSWREAVKIVDWNERKRAVFSLYKEQLKLHGAEYVVHFDLYEGAKDRLVYAIFHATKHPKGCDRMKQAIWAVAPFDGMAFRPGTGRMIDLFSADRSELMQQLRQRFGDTQWHDVDELEEWTMTDATVYHSGHLRSALVELENASQLEARAGTGKKLSLIHI